MSPLADPTFIRRWLRPDAVTIVEQTEISRAYIKRSAIIRNKKCSSQHLMDRHLVLYELLIGTNFQRASIADVSYDMTTTMVILR